MKSLVEALKGAATDTKQPADRVVFTPDVPQASMVHVHVKGPKEELEAARDAAVKSTQGKDYQYF